MNTKPNNNPLITGSGTAEEWEAAVARGRQLSPNLHNPLLASDLVIRFHTNKQRQWFLTYMSCFGEQIYWDWMEEQERNDPDEVMVEFDYFGGGDKFITNGVLNTQPFRRSHV